MTQRHGRDRRRRGLRRHARQSDGGHLHGRRQDRRCLARRDHTGNIAKSGLHQRWRRYPDFGLERYQDARSRRPDDRRLQWRTGRVNTDGSFETNKQTAWWINFAKFEQGIAALGGGNVSVAAGRDIAETSVITVTQDEVGGGRTAREAKTVAITGGGDLTVAAGRDILGGVDYVDGGPEASRQAATSRPATRLLCSTSIRRDVGARRENPQLAIGDAALHRHGQRRH